MHDVVSIELPAWANVTPRRAAHIARVTALLERWADTMGLDAEFAAAWRDAGRWHDALRDAPEDQLRTLLDDATTSAPLLHGPAAALHLERDGETRRDVLDAIAHHTVGHVEWVRTGRALYMADYLEPGRPFARAERARLSDEVPNAFDRTFREVVRQRVAWTSREGHDLDPRTVVLWNAIR